MGSIPWLEQNAPGYRDLSANEREAMANFSLLWTVFEARALGANGSATAIRKLAESWANAGKLPGGLFDEPLSYFRSRYFSNGEPTQHFAGLHLRKNDLPGLVQAVLKGEENGAVAKATVALVVVYRYRNNLFHGVKWAYNMKGQGGNFRAASDALTKALDILGPVD